MSTTWNPADKDAGITLSVGNHVATAAAGNPNVRGTSSHSSGKWYAEFPTNSITSGGGAIGVCSGARSLTSNVYTLGVMMATGGQIVDDGSITDPAFGSYNGKHISACFDFTNLKAWFRYNGGNWNNSGAADPATNVGGNAATYLGSAAMFLFTWIQNAGSTTVNAGDSAFTYSIPSGFTAWDSTPPPPPRAFGRIIG